MNYEFHPEALTELENAVLHYATKRVGLAQRFFESVKVAIQRVIEHPSSYAILEQDVRRCLTRVFPYAVLYTIEPNCILIVAVMHCHQKPGYWRYRVAS